MSEPKLNIKEETSTKKTRSPPKKAKVEQSVPKKKKLKLDADKAAEKAQHLRFGKAELTPDELSRLSKAQKREMSMIFPKAAMPGSSRRKLRCRARKAPKPLNLLHRGQLRHKMQAHPVPARAVPTGFHGGGRNRTSGRVTMLPPGQAQRHRPQAAKRQPTVHLPPGPA